MEIFTNVMESFNDIVWSTPLVVLCLGAGLFFLIRMRFPQFRLIKEMARLLTAKNKSEDGITPFQAFAATVGSRVGMGNIAGVATAIFFGGPGAVFWMWCIAFLGASSALVESALAQAYKTKINGVYIGGPAYFIEKGLKCKPYAIAFAVATVLGPGILMPGLHTYSIATTFSNVFGVNMIATSVVFVAILGVVICGGIKRIGKTAEYLAPVMCVIYVGLGLVVIILNIKELPGVLSLIFTSAFGMKQIYAGILGSAIAWGVKRGIYSNEAGQGSGAIVSAAAECSHPASQGLVQAFSVYIDTLIVCSSSAFIILLTGSYNVQGSDGALITANIPDVEYGISWAQHALSNALGSWCGKLLAIVIVMFVFTSLMGYYYQAESNMIYLFGGKRWAAVVIRVIFLASTFSGVLVNGEIIWTMGDTGAGLMAWLNIIAIILLYKKGTALLKDYEEQKKAGREPVFDPGKFGIEDETGVWK